MKQLLSLLLSLSLVACGFTPMYSQNKTSDVFVAPVSGTNGIDLRNALNAKFGGSHDEMAEYKLVVNLDSPVTKYKAIQSTGDATWQEVRITARYVLTKDDKEIMKGTDSAAESYTFVRYLVAANASYNNAVQNSIGVLADKIGMRVLAVTAGHQSSVVSRQK